MRDDPLLKLLRDADAFAAPPPPRRDFIATVRQRARRDRAARRSLAVAMLLVVAGLAILRARPAVDPSPELSLSVPPPAVTPSRDAAAARREFDRLNDEAASQERAAQILLARERASAQRRRWRSNLADDPLASQLERSALTLVNQGEHLLQDPTTHAEAQQAFERVLQLFPQCRSARLAKERLDEMGA